MRQYLDFFRQIFENTQVSIFMKIRPVGAEVFYADGQTDVYQLHKSVSLRDPPSPVNEKPNVKYPHSCKNTEHGHYCYLGNTDNNCYLIRTKLDWASAPMYV